MRYRWMRSGADVPSPAEVRNRWKASGRRDPESEAIDLRAQVIGDEVAIDLGRDPRIAVAKDPLHGGRVRAGPEQQAGRGVAEIVKADFPDQRLRPDTLARDLAVLGRRGYRATAVTPYDMLPHTPHVETLAILKRLPFAC
jgi:hypothetical protein